MTFHSRAGVAELRGNAVSRLESLIAARGLEFAVRSIARSDLNDSVKGPAKQYLAAKARCYRARFARG